MKNLYFIITNYGYLDIVKNFLQRCIELDSILLNSLVIVCLDKTSYNALGKYTKYGCILLVDECDDSITDKFLEWQSTDYKTLVFYKLNIKTKILKMFHNIYDNIIYIDTDIWINNNFITLLNTYLANSDYDVIFQDGEDYLLNHDECTEIIDSKLVYKHYCYSYCTGFMIMNTKNYQKIIDDLFTYNHKDMSENSGNQSFINKQLLSSDLKILTLPKSVFPNLSVDYLYKQNKNYWMLHYTYVTGKNKISNMKINNHWLLS